MTSGRSIRIGWLTACTAALLGSSPAFAQAETLALAQCKRLANSEARLKCFDAIGDAVDGAKPAQMEIRAGEWNIVQSKSPIDDSPQISAGLLSEDRRSSIILRCAERKTEVILLPRSLFVFDKANVVVRLNDLPAATASWSSSTDHKALFAPSGVTFVKMLPDNGTLFIRAAAQTKSEDAVFKLGQVSAVRDRISTACKWQDGRAQTGPTSAK